MWNYGVSLLIACFACASVAVSMPSSASAQTATATGTQSFQTVLPGKINVQVFSLQISNTLLIPMTLTSVRFKNTSVASGGTGATQAQLDAELGQPRLYQGTTLLKQSTASGGYLTFSGLNVAINMLGSVTVVVVTDIPLT